jgi:hypothetical protein
MLRILSVLILLCIFLSACEKPVAVDPVKSAKAVAWLTDRYKKHPPDNKGSLRITKIEAQDTNIDISVRARDDIAEIFPRLKENAAFKWAADSVCPEITEEIWSILDPHQRIMLHIVGSSGEAFMHVDCLVGRMMQ